MSIISVSLAAIGGLSKTSKMNCYSYSIPATECKAGAKLSLVKGSVCEKCYARHGRYNFPNVQKALARRFEALKSPDWSENMIKVLSSLTKKYFRWHDSGDIQSIGHLKKLVHIVSQCPDMKFWLPTKELGMVNTFLKTGTIPDNLCIRISAPMIDQRVLAQNGYQTSMVVSDSTKAINAALCSAPQNKGKCGDCRACWDKTVSCVAYIKH